MQTQSLHRSTNHILQPRNKEHHHFFNLHVEEVERNSQITVLGEVKEKDSREMMKKVGLVNKIIQYAQCTRF